ncbi:MAG: hypothetical protein WC010_01790 [Candidatus Absconditabacterales bacterium]
MSGIIIVLISPLLYDTYAATAIVSLEVTGIGIRHGTPANVNLGTIIASPGDQEFSGQFSNYFRVDDMQGYITGYYTTIQCDGIYGSTGNKLTGVYLKAGNIIPEYIQGITGNHILINSILSTYTNILLPITYLYKETHIDNKGLINKYGDKPWIKIFIPGGTPPGSYSGTIVFSFYSY